jgi:hypothetical protein
MQEPAQTLTAGEEVDDVDDDGGDDGPVLEDATRRRRELCSVRLPEAVTDQAHAADDKHGDQGRVLVAVFCVRGEGEGEKELCV